MPYARNSELPDAVKALPSAGQTMYRKTFNSAMAQYGNEGTAHATAWAQVKTKYKKAGDRWVAKEASKMLKEDVARIMSQAPESSAVRDYHIEAEGGVVLGDNDEKVLATVVYKPIDAVREAYAELIQEAGERGVSAESIREAAESCSTLIDAEKPDEDAVESALKVIRGALEWVRLQEATKSEGGISFSSAAYAYVPDPDKPSTWKLRLWEDLDKKATVEQVGRAAAAFSPGGFRGHRVQLPAAAVGGVKAKIRAAYRRLGVESEDMSKWVLEVEMRERVIESCEIDIQEVTKAGIAQGIVPVRIIVPGFNSSKARFYSEQAVSDAAEIFDGSKMFVDHPTDREDEEKPERSLWNWVATLHNTKVSGHGNAIGEAHIHDGPFKEKAKNLYENGDLEHLGVSINAVGKGTNQTIEGQKTVLVEGLVKVTNQSVDFVTYPGAGGQAGLRESVRDGESSVDVDLMDLAQLREARPDLVTDIEAEAKETLRLEIKEAKDMETTMEDLQGQVTTLTEERDGLQTKIDEAERARVKAEAQATIKEAVGKAELPDAAKEKLLTRFTDAESDEGVAEAIKAEADYIATLLEAGKVKGLGPKASEEVDAEKSHKRLVESFKRMGMSDEEAETAAKGR